MTRRRDLGTYQMLWDCGYCGTAKLLGLNHRHCPTCGSAQDPDRRYFPSDEDKVAVEDHQFTGADWQCPACDSPNATGAEFCVNCGNGHEDGKTVGQREERAAAAGTSFEQDDIAQAAREAKARRQEEREEKQTQYEARRAAAAGREPPRKGGSKGKTVLWVVLGVVAVILIFMFWKSSATVTVAGHTWTREINIERFQAVDGDTWCDEIPGDAYSITRRREERRTRQVQDGETCQTVQQDQGDGTFKEIEECSPRYRDESVYDQKCYFNVDRWVEFRTETAAGASLTETPRWPDLTLAQTGSRLGAEREGERAERYVVTFRDDEGETHECAFPEDQWRSFSIGHTIEAEIGGVTGNLSCRSLR